MTIGRESIMSRESEKRSGTDQHSQQTAHTSNKSQYNGEEGDELNNRLGANRRSVLKATLGGAGALFIPGTGSAEEGSPNVVPIDWSNFEAGKPSDDLSQDQGKVLLNECKYLVTTWWNDDFTHFKDTNSGYASIRGRPDQLRASNASFALAVAIATDQYDEDYTSVSEEDAKRRAVKMIKSMAYHHTANSDDGWGPNWLSPRRVYYTAWAAWLLWDAVGTIDRENVRKMLEYEANRLKESSVAYSADSDNNVVSPGDTKSEEEAWYSSALHLAAVMMPNHPNKGEWMYKSVEKKVGSYARPLDLELDTPINGDLLSNWIDGSNMFNDGTLVNHGIIHPDYIVAHQLNLDSALMSGLRDQPTPEAARLNSDSSYKALSDLEFPEDEFMDQGGTMFVDGSPDLYYPEGTDWGTDRVVNYLVFDAYASTMGLDDKASRSASYWERLRTNKALSLQERHADGHMYGPNSDYTFVAREPHVALFAGLTYLSKWLDHNLDRIEFTNRPYTQNKSKDGTYGAGQGPNAPRNPVTTKYDDRVEIEWEPPEKRKSISHYSLYRTPLRFKVYTDITKIGESKNTSFADTDIDTGQNVDPQSIASYFENLKDYLHFVTAVGPTGIESVASEYTVTKFDNSSAWSKIKAYQGSKAGQGMKLSDVVYEDGPAVDVFNEVAGKGMALGLSRSVSDSDFSVELYTKNSLKSDTLHYHQLAYLGNNPDGDLICAGLGNPFRGDKPRLGIWNPSETTWIDSKPISKWAKDKWLRLNCQVKDTSVEIEVNDPKTNSVVYSGSFTLPATPSAHAGFLGEIGGGGQVGSIYFSDIKLETI